MSDGGPSGGERPCGRRDDIPVHIEASLAFFIVWGVVLAGPSFGVVLGVVGPSLLGGALGTAPRPRPGRHELLAALVVAIAFLPPDALAGPLHITLGLAGLFNLGQGLLKNVGRLVQRGRLAPQ